MNDLLYIQFQRFLNLYLELLNLTKKKIVINQIITPEKNKIHNHLNY